MLRRDAGVLMSQLSAQHRSSRYPIQLPLLYWRQSTVRTRAGAGWTRELGEGGITVELAEPVESEVPLRIRIQTDRGPIEAQAKVAWIGAPTGQEAEYCYGLTFTEIAPDHLQALQDLLLPLSMVPHAGMRLALDLSATCRPKHAGGLLLKGRVGEVSRGGLLLRLPQGVPRGTALEITLDSGKGPVSLEGEIAWVQTPSVAHGSWLIEHGVRFTSSTWSVSLALGFLMAGRP